MANRAATGPPDPSEVSGTQAAWIEDSIAHLTFRRRSVTDVCPGRSVVFASVSKTVVAQVAVGSNPTPSAKAEADRSDVVPSAVRARRSSGASGW